MRPEGYRILIIEKFKACRVACQSLEVSYQTTHT